MAGRRARAGLALAALGLTAAACGSGVTRTVTRVRTVTLTRTVTTTPKPAVAAACSGSQLSGTFTLVPGSAGAGQVSYLLTLTNTSQSACFVTGGPQVQLLGTDASNLPTNGMTTAGPRVPLAPGQAAVATARFSPDVPGQGDSQSGPCQPKAYTLKVQPNGPGTVDVPIQPPTSVCEQGRLTFQPFSAR